MFDTTLRSLLLAVPLVLLIGCPQLDGSPNTHTGDCTIASGTPIGDLPISGPAIAFGGGCQETADGGYDLSQPCWLRVGSPYSGSCIDSSGEGGTWECDVYVVDGGAGKTRTDCFN